MTEHDPAVAAVKDIVRRICPILSGNPPEVQSAALADLVAMWLAGYQNVGGLDDSALLKLREVMFESWCATVRALVPVNAARIREQLRG